MVKLFLVTPTYNSESTVADTFKSIGSEMEQIEHYYVVDGASGDSTVVLAQSFAQKNLEKVTVVSEPDKGIYDAMNKGVTNTLRLADPEDLIAIINSDDYYVEGAVEKMCEFANLHPDIDIFYGDVNFIDLQGAPTGEISKSAIKLIPQTWTKRNPVWHPTMFIRARAYLKVGLYNCAYPISADYDWLISAYEHGLNFCYVESPIVNFRIGGVSMVQIKRSEREAARVRIAHGSSPIREALFAWSLWTIRSLYRMAELFGAVDMLRRIRGRR